MKIDRALDLIDMVVCIYALELVNGDTISYDHYGKLGTFGRQLIHDLMDEWSDDLASLSDEIVGFINHDTGQSDTEQP